MLLAHLNTLLPLAAVSLEVPLFNAMCWADGDNIYKKEGGKQYRHFLG